MRATEAELPPRTRQRALFITKLVSDTTAEDVLNHLRKVLPGDVPIQVTQLRSEYQEFHASFHVAVPPEVFGEINDSNIWPVKARFRPFRGKLHDYRKLNPNTEREEESESPRRKAARRDNNNVSVPMNI